MPETSGLIWSFSMVVVALAVLATVFASFYSIGPTQIGLVRKRIGRKLPGNNPVAFEGEAGYQADLLMPGVRFKFKPFYTVTKHPWVQVPAGQIGVVIAQVGKPTPIGAKSGRYDCGFRQLYRLPNVCREGRREGRAKAGSFSRHTGADSSGGFSRHHQAAGLRRSGV